MKVNLTQLLHAMDGTPLVDRETGKPITLGIVIENSALAQLPTDMALSPKEKFRLLKIALDVADKEEAALPAKDIELILRRIAMCQPTIIFGRCSQHLGEIPE